jgi:hypothetical protein
VSIATSRSKSSETDESFRLAGSISGVLHPIAVLTTKRELRPAERKIFIKIHV